MSRQSSLIRWLLTGLLLAALSLGALGQSLVKEVQAAPQALLDSTSTSTPTSTGKPNFEKINFVGHAPVAAPGSADLSLVMTVDNPLPNVGDSVIFTITVSNAGPDTATGVSVKDILPSGLAYVSDNGGGTYNKTTGIWGVGSIPVGGTSQLKITATFSVNATIENDAEVWTSDQTDPNSIPGNGNTLEDDYAKIVFNSKTADLKVTKTVLNGTPNAGDNVQFTITVENLGPDNADHVVVKDLLPDGLQYISDSTGGTYDKSTGLWVIGTLLASGTGSSYTMTIIAKVTTIGTKTNVAQIWKSDEYDSNISNNSSTILVTPRSADLSLTMDISDPALVAGDPVKFTITVKNAGPDDATNVTVNDLLPSPDYSYLNDDGGGIYNNVTGDWSIGSLTNGQTKILNINATVSVNGPTTNWAEVSHSDQFDPNSTPGNRLSVGTEDDAAGAPYADLSVTKTVDKTSAYAGENVVFKLTVKNAGPGNASNVSVEDILPSGLTYVSVTGAGTYDHVNGTWNIGFIQYQTSAILEITANVSGGVSKNIAELWTANQYDPDSTPKNGATSEDDYATVTVNGLTDAKSVIITEVAWMGTQASSDNQWIELYNPTNHSINMEGWQIRSFTTIKATPQIILISAYSSPNNPNPSCKLDHNNDGSVDCLIPAKSYFLLVRGRQDAVSGIPPDVIEADVVYPAQGNTKLSSGGSELLLCTPANISANNCKPTTPNLNNVVVDVANNYNNGPGIPTPSASTSNPWPAGNSIYYGTMERKNLQSNEDSNWFTHPSGAAPRYGEDFAGNRINGTPKHDNWAFDVTATPHPTATPTRTPTAVPIPGPVLVLNEFLARPGHDWNGDGVVNGGDEFIEVINAGVVSLNLSSYKLDDYEVDASGNEIKNGFSLPSKTLQPGEIAVFYGSQTGIILNDSGDTVRLVKSSNYTIVDAYTYGPVLALDVSACRYTDAYGSWLTRCFPTPGLPNALTGDVYPPQPGGGPSAVCLVPDSAPPEFLLAECKQGGLGIFNPALWDAPDGSTNSWFDDLLDKWRSIFQ